MIKMAIFNFIHFPVQQTLVSFFLLVFLLYCQVSGGITATAKSDLLNANGKKQDDTRNFTVDPLEIKKIRVYSNVVYRYSSTEVSSIVRNNDNRMSHEYNFTMRIPNNAFISNFSITTNNETYHSFMAEKEIGTCLYQIQKMRQLSAGLLEMDKDSKLFNVNVNVKPLSEIEFSLKYDELINWENGHYEYNIYMNQLQMKTAKNFIVALDVKDLYRINSLNINNVKEKRNIKDDVKKERKGTSASLIWEPSKNGSNYAKLISEDSLGQFLIYYSLQRESKPGEILLRDGYFVHTLNTENLPVLQKHVIFVLDISGSMEGEPLNQLRAAMKNILDDLGPDDFFNIITFSSGVQNWSPLRRRCSTVVIPFKSSSSSYKNGAINFINTLQVHGSTNIHDALLEALELWKGFRANNKGRECFYPQNYHQMNITPMILFLTDGEPTSGVIDHQQILQTVHNRNTEQIPIFSLAFGFEADFQFVKTLSLQNHGFSRQIFVGIESHLQLENFYREISSPVLTNVTFVYTSSIFNTSDISFKSFPTVNRGTEIQVTGKVKARYQITEIDEEDSLFNVSSFSSHNNPKVSNIPVHCPCGCQRKRKNSDEDTSEKLLFSMHRCSEKDDFSMEKRWAYIHIMNLLSNDTAGSQEIRNEIIEWSIKYRFLTPYTSLVVFKPNTNAIVMEAVDTDRFSGCKVNPRNAVSKRKRFKPPNNTPTVGSALQQLEGGSTPVKHYYLQSSNRERNSTKKDYILLDLTWYENHNMNISIMKGENVSEFYQIQRNYQRDESHSQPCYIRSSSTPGKCKPLQECIVAEILTDFNIFLKSHFCPILNRHGKFIGTCCPN